MLAVLREVERALSFISAGKCQWKVVISVIFPYERERGFRHRDVISEVRQGAAAVCEKKNKMGERL